MISIIISFVIWGLLILHPLIDYITIGERDAGKQLFRRTVHILPILAFLILMGNLHERRNHTSFQYKNLEILSMDSSIMGKDNSYFIINEIFIKRPMSNIPLYRTLGRDSTGKLKIITLDARNITIIKSDSETPRIEKFYRRTKISPYKSVFFFSNEEEFIGKWRRSPKDPILVVPLRLSIERTKTKSVIGSEESKRRRKISMVINRIMEIRRNTPNQHKKTI